mmetsp:Transcript_14631/g.35263  ORF Transcript_14631/g.35263 Transcript_14631/m.35263 type:complete len:153 (+) Transcript_14631:1633-2091(+)
MFVFFLCNQLAFFHIIIGWIATNPLGNSTITFSVELPLHECYVVYIAILRSYKGMGTFGTQVRDYGERPNQLGEKPKRPKKITTKDGIDGLWDAPISVWSDIQITEDNIPGCTGYCEISVITNPMKDRRVGNKVKILTISARKCSPTRSKVP